MNRLLVVAVIVIGMLALLVVVTSIAPLSAFAQIPTEAVELSLEQVAAVFPNDVVAVASYTGQKLEGAHPLKLDAGSTVYVPIANLDQFPFTLYVQNATAVEATIQIAFRDTTGAKIYQIDDAIAAHGVNGYENPAGLPAGFEGSAAITSNREAYVIVNIEPLQDERLMSYEGRQSGAVTAVVNDSLAGHGFEREATWEVAAPGDSWIGPAMVSTSQPVAAEVLQSSTPTDSAGITHLPFISSPPKPSVPSLYPISNDDDDGAYHINWSTASLAESYELQEDDHSSFTSPTTRYSGTGTTYVVSGQWIGTWYYRVRACNRYGCSNWSDPIRSVHVLPCDLYVENNTGGTLCIEVYGSGKGRKCFGTGDHYYGRFTAGTYSYHVSAGCGTINDTRRFSGTVWLEYWCG